MSLNFGFTCPDIDEGLRDAKGYIEDYLFDLLEGFVEDDDVREDLIKTYTEYIYGDVSTAFERVRDCNSDLRKAAEEQIEELENDKENLDYRVAELEDERDE